MCTEGLGGNEHELMSRACEEFLAEIVAIIYLHHDAHCRLPNLFKQGYKLAGCISVARVQPRTSNGITDLSLPQTALRQTHKVPPRSNQIRIIPESFQQAEASFVNGINQTNTPTTKNGKHHNTQSQEKSCRSVNPCSVWTW